MLGNCSILGMSTTDYYMMSLRQKTTSIEKFTSLGKISAQLCRGAGFQIIKGIQSYGAQLMDDAECVLKGNNLERKRKSIG